MSYKVGDTCYTVVYYSLSQFSSEEYCPVDYAENLRVVEAKVTAAVEVPIKRNGKTRMEYQIKPIEERYAYDIKRSRAPGREGKVWYESALFPSIEAAEEERQKQLVKTLEEVAGSFIEQLNSIRALIKSKG